MQEELNKLLKEKVGEKVGSKTYRGVPLAPVYTNLLYWKITKMNSYISLYDLDRFEAKRRLSNIIDNELQKVSFSIFYLIIGIGSILKWIQHSFRKSPSNHTDVLINIDHKKYLNHTKGLFNQLKKNGASVVWFAWDFAGIKAKDKSVYHEKRKLPAFWIWNYWKYAQACWYIDVAYSACERIKPKKIVVVEGDNYTHHIFGYLARQNLALECICLQWGYVGTEVPKPGWQNMPFDKYLAWGDFFKNRFSVYNPGLNILSVGHPNLVKPSVNKKNVILFAVQKEMKPYVFLDDIDTFIHAAISCANNLSNFTIRVRTHPHHSIVNMNGYDTPNNFEWHEYDKFTLQDSFSDVAVCVSICSTLSLEAVFYGAVAAYIKLKDLDLQIYRDALQNDTSNMMKLFGLDDFCASLEELMSKEYNGDFNYFFVKGGGEALDNIVNSIFSHEEEK